MGNDGQILSRNEYILLNSTCNSVYIFLNVVGFEGLRDSPFNTGYEYIQLLEKGVFDYYKT